MLIQGEQMLKGVKVQYSQAPCFCNIEHLVNIIEFWSPLWIKIPTLGDAKS